MKPRPKPIDPNAPRYELKELSGYHSWRSPKIFEDMNSACDFAAKCYASRIGLPTDKRYHLQWEIVMRDEEYTRVYRAKGTDYVIVAHKI